MENTLTITLIFIFECLLIILVYLAMKCYDRKMLRKIEENVKKI